MEDQTSKVVTDRLASTSIKKPSSTRLSTRPLNLTETDQDVVARGTQNSPLPPSVETAYYRKCIELKRRINEIEESNDAARLRKVRINRQILKMRLERAFLLEQLQKRMENNVDDSDRSSSPPPTVRPEVLTPHDKPMRSKRAHGKRTPPPSQPGAPGAVGTPSGGSIILPSLAPNSHPPPEHAHGYFDSTAPPPAGLIPIQPSASGGLPPGSFQPIQPAGMPYTPPAATFRHHDPLTNPYIPPAPDRGDDEEVARQLQEGGLERYDERSEEREDRGEAPDRGSAANGTADHLMDGESKSYAQESASMSGFTAVNAAR